MDDQIDENSVNTEVAPPQLENIHVEQTPVSDKKNEEQERNWRALRQRKDELERELRKKDEMLEKAMNMAMTQSKPQEIDELEQLDDSEFIPKGKQKKLVKKEVEPLQKEIEALKNKLIQQEQAQILSNIRIKYSDFDQIVNAETLAKLDEQEPELAATIASMNDPYKMAIQSYKYIKALNITEPSSTNRRAKEIEEKIEKNNKTVQSPLAYDKRPMAKAFDYDDILKNKEKQNELFKEMMDHAGKAGFSY